MSCLIASVLIAAPDTLSQPEQYKSETEDNRRRSHIFGPHASVNITDVDLVRAVMEADHSLNSPLLLNVLNMLTGVIHNGLQRY